MTLSLLKGQLSVVIFFVFLFSLFTIHSLFTNEVLAAPGDAPNPKPCENALNANYTMNALDPISFTVSETASPGTEVTAEKTVYFNVDFSKLQAVFGKPSSDYLESRFQDEPHREIDILSLESADFNKFHGPNQKITPKSLIDPERVKYVEDVYNKPELAESANKFSDINGENPHTIYELIHDLGFPYPPNPPEGDEDRTEWLRTWGRYWEKIPTAVSEFNYGRLLFLPVSGQSNIQQHEQGQAGTCPIPLRTIYFVLPEFARTTSISSQANRVVVPKAAQSFEKSLLAKAGEKQHRTQRAALVEFLADRHEADRKGGQEQRGHRRAGLGYLVDEGDQDPVGEHEQGPRHRILFKQEETPHEPKPSVSGRNGPHGNGHALVRRSSRTRRKCSGSCACVSSPGRGR